MAINTTAPEDDIDEGSADDELIHGSRQCPEIEDELIRGSGQCPEIVDELIIEEISIDGMCGVY